MKNGLTIYSNGIKRWYQEDKLHRIDGPALEYPNGTKVWYKEDKLHRLDGPAIEWLDGKGWYYEGKFIKCSSQEEFIRLLNLKLFW